MKSIVKRLTKIFCMIVLLPAISMFLYLFISNINRTPKVGIWSIHKINKNYVSMNVVEDTISNNSATIMLTNLTNKEYRYGNEYTVEYYQNGMWHFLIPINEVGWLLNDYGLDPNTTVKIDFDWSNYYGKLPKGKYRIIQKFSLNESDNDFYVASEFNIK